MSLREYLKRGIRYVISGVPQKNVTANIAYLQPNQRLKGKHIIVTGGAKGIGLAITRKCLEEGAKVLVTGRDEVALKKVSDDYGCLYLKLDILSVDDFPLFVKRADELLGGVNCLVNNAGISLHEGNIRNVSLEQFDKQMNTNLRGGYFLAQKFIELLENTKRENGNILFVSSERGFFVDDLPYGLTKAAINSLTQGLACRVIDSKIRVNAIAPGVTASEMTGFSAEGNLYCPYNATERVYLPEEVAEVACFLLSDASKCLSGQILVCNEGKSINAHWK